MNIIQQGEQQDTVLMREKRFGGNKSISNIENILDSDSLCFTIKNHDGALLGGITGIASFEELHIDFLWIEELYRLLGYGSQLLRKVEEIAKERKYQRITIAKFSHRSLDFYKKHGYKELLSFCNNTFPEGEEDVLLHKIL